MLVKQGQGLLIRQIGIYRVKRRIHDLFSSQFFEMSPYKAYEEKSMVFRIISRTQPPLQQNVKSTRLDAYSRCII